jgi:hypothetical protein
MAPTALPDTQWESADIRPKLRTNVLDALMAAKGIRTVEAQAEYFELNRTHWFEIRSAKVVPNLGTAMRVARRAETTVEAIWEYAA